MAIPVTQNITNRGINQEDSDAIEILVKNIVNAIKLNNSNGDYDRTFKTSVRSVTATKGKPTVYTITDLSGAERTVKCAIPNVTISVGKMVYVTIPSGELRNMYISGLA